LIPLSDSEKRKFLGWLKTRRLHARQISEVARGSGRLAFADLIEAGFGQADIGLPPNLSREDALIQAAKLRSDALRLLSHFTRSSRVSSLKLMRLHRILREV